jgi:hypothetical protein
MHHAVNSKDKDLSIFKATRPPTTTQDFKNIYFEAKNAILLNLPHPVPQLTPDKTHAYVSLKDLLANELAKGTEFDSFHFESTLVLEKDDEPLTKSSTRAAYNLHLDLQEDKGDDEFTLHLWITEWRDDFDSNNTKASRNQVWINTYTICPPADESSGRNTYFMGMSCKGDVHSVVEVVFGPQVQELTDHPHLFYHGGVKKLIRVKAGKLSTCVDSPERSSMFHVGDHNGTYSTYWGHTCQVDGHCEDNVLPSCTHCRGKKIEEALNGLCSASSTIGSKCSQGKCSSWNVMDPSFHFPVPKGYPTSCDQRPETPNPPTGRDIVSNKRPAAQLSSDVDADPHLSTVILSIEWLKQVVLFAHHNMKTVPPDARNKNKEILDKEHAPTVPTIMWR